MKSIKEVNKDLKQFDISVKEDQGVCTVFTGKEPFMIISKNRLNRLYPQLMNIPVKLT